MNDASPKILLTGATGFIGGRLLRKLAPKGIRDEVTYRLPFWPAVEIVHPLTAAQLRRIICTRKQAIEQNLRTGF